MVEELFADPAKGASQLAVGPPAIGAGADSPFHSGAERVPDFSGDPQPEGLPAVGVDERP
jgi:hypothetical protein